METLRVLHDRSRSSASEFNKNMQSMLTDGGDTPIDGTFFIRFSQLTQCLYDMKEADVKNKASGEQDRDLVRDLVGTEHLWNKYVKPNMAMQADEGIAIAEEDKTVVHPWFR
ncbi:unnamed protein product [Zymoseptoria tritici ST99CH_1A5]|uniref:Uncharacterized protein n=1 Tax=Zymoseptoria tritici ST99CH_1A5 TaxID=1276529 RepID=A0A1Y6LWV8_ZYMTR|nr:unnamed protein product [Zymoseptoria tritici ST99CH_3D1]SMY28863.1 unnamed protein product [Zymoseptoria tritici ST99CH_1A5]